MTESDPDGYWSFRLRYHSYFIQPDGTKRFADHWIGVLGMHIARQVHGVQFGWHPFRKKGGLATELRSAIQSLKDVNARAATLGPTDVTGFHSLQRRFRLISLVFFVCLFSEMFLNYASFYLLLPPPLEGSDRLMLALRWGLSFILTGLTILAADFTLEHSLILLERNSGEAKAAAVPDALPASEPPARSSRYHWALLTANAVFFLGLEIAIWKIAGVRAADIEGGSNTFPGAGLALHLVSIILPPMGGIAFHWLMENIGTYRRTRRHFFQRQVREAQARRIEAIPFEVDNSYQHLARNYYLHCDLFKTYKARYDISKGRTTEELSDHYMRDWESFEKHARKATQDLRDKVAPIPQGEAAK